MIKKILIIGGYGFLGYNLANSLPKSNYEITLLCRKEKKKLKKLKKINYIYADITNFSKLNKVIKNKYNIVINLSGNINHNDKIKTFKVHHAGFKNILKIFKNKKIDLFIQAGSSLEYGRSHSPQKEKKVCKPNSYYGKAKLLASNELIADKVFPNYIILRLYQVFGPYQKNDRLVPFVINNCLKDKKFNCSSGIQKRDFLYVEDFVNLIKKILKKNNFKSGVYNVGSGKPIIVKNMIKMIIKLIGKGEPIFGKIFMRKDEIKNLFPDISKVKKNFNWRPKNNLTNSLKKTINYYKKTINVKI